MSAGGDGTFARERGIGGQVRILVMLTEDASERSGLRGCATRARGAPDPLEA
jgi:hypothetical protein